MRGKMIVSSNWMTQLLIEGQPLTVRTLCEDWHWLIIDWQWQWASWRWCDDPLDVLLLLCVRTLRALWLMIDLTMTHIGLIGIGRWLPRTWPIVLIPSIGVQLLMMKKRPCIDRPDWPLWTLTPLLQPDRMTEDDERPDPVKAWRTSQCDNYCVVFNWTVGGQRTDYWTDQCGNCVAIIETNWSWPID